MTDQEMLAQAKQQYHLLTVGLAPRVFVDQNGERIEYTMANSGRLRRYIEELEAKINGTRLAPPARVFF